MKYKYIPTQTTLADDKFYRTSWGVALVETSGDIAVVIDEYSDISQNIEDITNLVRLCNEMELDKSHFADVVEDFLAK
ncbi:MAG: hypothetical protein E7656_10270 [Ruminococcaceae bacterium]|nr:hypothetical protein [Oscillospiraceae bacterium]